MTSCLSKFWLSYSVLACTTIRYHRVMIVAVNRRLLHSSFRKTQSLMLLHKATDCGGNARNETRNLFNMIDGTQSSPEGSSWDCAISEWPYISRFGYHFDRNGIMKDKDDKGFIFTDQQTYEAIGEAITEEIYRLLQQPPYSLCKTFLGKTSKENTQRSFVFHSKDFDSQKHLVVLIHGSGVVRAGQWARRLIMNESLDRGTQLPYIRECFKRGWGVLLMNTNHNTFTDENGQCKGFEASGTPIEHGISVWKDLVMQSKAESIAVIAHSAGGMVISNIIEDASCWPSNSDRSRLRCICLTDSFFKAPSLLQIPASQRPRIRHWIAYSSDQIGTPLPSTAKNSDSVDSYVERVTAGTNIHEETSPVAINDIFRFIQSIFVGINL